MFIFFQEHTDSWHFISHLDKPCRVCSQFVTQAEACCKQPLSFLYLLPRWVGAQPSSTFNSSTPSPPLPALALSSTCLQASRSTAYPGLKSSTSAFLWFFFPFSHIQLSCWLLTGWPALTNPSMPCPHSPTLPSFTPDILDSFTHTFFEEPLRLQPGFWQMLIRDEAEVARPYKLLQE